MSVADRVSALTPEQRALFERLRDREQRRARLRRPPPIERVSGPTAEGDWPLSLDQERYWFMEQLYPSGAGLNITAATRMRGVLPAALVATALSEIARRHAAWRTVFPAVDGRPVQRVLAPRPQPLGAIDLQGLPAARREAEALRLVGEETAAPFDLERGPLVRATLVLLASEDRVCLLTIHHLVTDWISSQLAWVELAAIVSALAVGAQPALPEPPVQYPDFAVWQRAWLTGEVLADLTSWWRRQLEGFPAALDLPGDRPRPAQLRMRGGKHSFTAGGELADGMRGLARQEGATLFMLVLAATATLLHRDSGEERIVLGANNANRNRPEIEQVLGCFLTQVPFAIDLAGDPTYRELLQRVRQAALAAYAHQDLPFGLLVQALQLARDPARQPLIQTLVQVLDGQYSGTSLAGASFAALDAYDGRARYDLMLTVFDYPDCLLGTLEYDADLFDAATNLRRIERFLLQAAAAVATPDLRLSALPVLSPAALHQVAVEWNDTARPRPDWTAPRRFAEQAARQPAAPALVAGRESMSFGELERRAGALARRLRALGVGTESRVALLLPRTFDVVVAILATWKAGGAYLPLDPDAPPGRLAELLADAAPRVVIHRGGLPARGPAGQADATSIGNAATRPAQAGVPWAALDLASDGEDRGDSEDGAAGEAALPEVEPGQLAYLIYTSGTTGRPKAVMIEHGSLAVSLASFAALFGLRPGDRVPQLARPTFDASFLDLVSPLVAGATVEIVDEEEMLDPARLLEVVARSTAAFSVPALLRRAAPEARALGVARFAGLRMLGVGADLVSPDLQAELLASFPGAEVRVLYGPTETAILCAAHRVPPERQPRRALIGRPLPEVELRVVDGRGERVALGLPGELWIGGPGVGRGYLGRPELTAERFVAADGRRFYRSGDLVRQVPAEGGALEFLGRTDLQVKVRGFRIEPGEIEAALREHPDVGEAVVTAPAGPAGDRQLAAYVVPAPAAAAVPAAEALRAFLRERLPEHMVPAVFVPLAALPLSPNGKVDRRALPAPAAARAALAGAAEPRNATEDLLAGIWREALGLARVGIHDNFFQLGGDSILSIQVVARARRHGLLVTPKLFFDNQTIAELAAAAAPAAAADAADLVDAASSGTAASGTGAAAAGAEQGEVSGEVPLTPIQCRFFAEDRRQPGRFNQALLLVPRRRLDAAPLAAALARLAAHHDALRLRFRRREAGWVQLHAPATPAAAAPLIEVDLAALPPAAQAAALAAAAERLQAGLDLAAGPLFSAALFRQDEERRDRLLLTAHHLVVDGVSWRVLLEDLNAAYERLAAGAAPALPPKTTSWKSWAERLAAYARTPELAAAELAHWLAAGEAARPLPCDLPPAAAGGGLATASAELDAGATRALLHAAPEAYRTQINDLLLAALARCLAAWSGESTLWLDLEGHGREEIFPSVDLSRTVGWFTTLYPVRLALPPGGGPREAILAVKQTLRAVPGRGLGYGLLRYLAAPAVRARLAPGGAAAPPVSFNYLGRFDPAAAGGAGEEGLFELAPEAPRGTAGEPVAGRHLFAIDAVVVDGSLRVSWTYDPAVHLASTAERLAQALVDEVAAITAHCLSPQAGGHVPSDFPLAGLDQGALDRLLGSDRGVEDLYPLAPLQEGILFHSVYTAGVELYVEQLTAELLGPLDTAAFGRAWQRLVERHPALRTAFLWQTGGRPLQLVRRQAEMPFTVEDWRGLPAAAAERRWRALVAADRARGFDLGRPPLMRLTVVRTGEASQRLLWTFHHLIFDGWCFALLLRDVFALYRLEGAEAAAGAGAAAGLPPRPRPFRDYIAWLAERDAAAAEEHWRRALAGFAAATPLPYDRAAAFSGGHGGAPSLAGDFHERRAAVAPRLAAALDGLAQRLRVTLNTLVQGAWALLLARAAQLSEVVYGAVVSGRPAELPGVESMVGLFINTLPVRVDVPTGESAAAWLVRLQAMQFELRQHEWTPLARIQALAEVPAGEPLFDSLLAFENYPIDPAAAEQLEDLSIGALEVGERTNYPLTLTVVARGALELRLTASHRFEPATTRRLLGHLETLLGALVERPERPPRELPLLSAGERHQLVVEWNDTAAAQAAEASIAELFAAQAARRPAAPALRLLGPDAPPPVTYGELAQRAATLAADLRRRGVARGDLVGVVAERSAELVTAILAVLWSGAAYLPLDPSHPRERLAFVLDDVDCRLVLAQPDLADRLPSVRAQVVPLAAGGGEAGAEAPPPPGAGAGGADLAYVLYTSGSTGRPKGVAVPQRAVVRLVRDTGYASFGPGEVFLMMAPVSFDASTFEIWGALLNGGCLAILPPGEVTLDGLAAAVRRGGVTTMWLTAGLFHLVVDERPQILAPLRQLFAGGDVLSPPHVSRLRRALPELRLTNGYGPTENTTFTACERLLEGGEGVAEGARVPIGRPIAGTSVLVLGRDLDPVPIGVPGELHAGGSGLAMGYAGRPELTAAAFVPSPVGDMPGERLYRTGDLVRRLPDGRLDFLGRIDRQLKVRGFRIEPGEIEAALADHPAVREAAVLALREAAGREPRLVACAVPRDGERPAAEAAAAVLAHLAERLPAYLVPAELVWMAALPLAPTGKVDRAALAAQLAARASTEAETEAAGQAAGVSTAGQAAGENTAGQAAGQTKAAAQAAGQIHSAAEEALGAVWRQVLGRQRIGVHDSFFALGGDSILSIQVVARARQAGWVVTPRQVFEEQTIARLAAVAAPLAAAAAEQGPVEGEAPLTPVQRWFFAQRMPAPHHFNQSLLLLPRAPLAAVPLARALAALAAHHDALRLRFAPGGDGAWRTWHAAVEPRPALAEIDLAALPPPRRAAALEAAAAALQGGFHLAARPLFRAARFRLGGGVPERLLLLAHHLVVDGVSWRILLDDLDAAYTQAAAGRAPALPPKTTSWKQWAERLAEHARSVAVRAELPYWLALPADVAPLPGGGRDGGGASGDGVGAAGAAGAAGIASFQTSLAREVTASLLGAAPAAAYRASAEDLLLASLVRAFARWTVPASGETRLRFDLETHGRAEIAPDLDLSRTVGWFTAIFPVVLDASGGAPPAAGTDAGAAPPAPGDPGEHLRAVKETLRAVPRRGLGYGLLRYLDGEGEAARLAGQGAPEVAFNYLGRLDSALGQLDDLDGARPFRLAPEPAGPDQAAGAPLRHAIEVNAWVLDGELRVAWTWDAGRFAPAVVERLAADHVAALAELVAHCAAPGAGGRTPSDFPLARLSAAEVDALAGRGAGLDRTIEDIYPLAPLQAGMLFAALYDRSSELYFEQLGAELTGPLDTAAFAAAWQAVAERHAVLRTAFVSEGLGRPLQVVRAGVALPWTEEDWRQVPEEDLAARYTAWLAADRTRGFDLGRAPLMRAALLRTGEQRHRFVWSFHHLLLDGWCFSPIFREVFELYRAAVGGGAAALPPVRPYRDFIAWVARQDPAAAARHFAGLLGGFAAPTRLPLDRPALPPGDDGEPRHQELRLPAPLAAALAGLARRRELTVNTLVQGAWGLLLARHGGDPDVVFGSVMSGRPAELPGVESMIGLFINTLPVRLLADPAAPLGGWLAGVQQRLLAVRQHETAALAEIQRGSDVPPGEPLFQSIVAFENYPVEELLGEGAGDLTVSAVTVTDRTENPLTLAVLPGRRGSGDLALRLAFDRRTDAATARRLLGHLELLLGAFPEALDALDHPLGALPASTAAERHQLLVEWNDTAAPPPAERTLHRLVWRQAALRSDAVALSGAGREVTYGELERRAARLARRLRAAGVQPEAPVAVVLDRSPDLVLAILGILEAGGAWVPIDPLWPAERLRFLLADARPMLALTNRALAGSVRAAAAGLPVLILDGGAGALAGSADAAAGAADGVAAGPDNLAYVIYTSGSTGAPKGVAICHGSAVAHVCAEALEAGHGPGDRAMLFASPAFDASMEEIFCPLASGAVVVPRRGPAEDAARFLAACAEQAITVLALPTAYWHQVAGALEQGGPAAPPALRLVIAGGERALPGRWSGWGTGAAAGVRLINAYGPTEATVSSVHHEHPRTPSPLAGRQEVPIGRPLAWQSAHVAAPDLSPVPVGGIGELLLGGEGVARGYLDRPALTAERFVPDPAAALSGRPGVRLYRTGDLARRLPDGTLEFAGRMDAQVKVRGFRIEPAEVEAALAAHPGVRAAAVMVRRDLVGDAAALAACVVPSPAAPTVEAAELRRFLAARLPPHMVPSTFTLLPALPVTPTGKLDRRALARLAAAPEGGAGRPAGTPPATAAERAMAALWQQVLGVAAPVLEDDFFALGGHSLLATQLVSRLRTAFGVDLPIRRLFEHPRLGDLTAVALAEPGVAAELVEVGRRPPGLDPVPASFAQERLWFLDRLQPGNTSLNMGGPLRLRGRLDVPALALALQRLVDRHEALRTTFVEMDGRPAQRIVAGLGVPLPVVDLASLPKERRDAEAERITGAALATPFDLAAGPLLRTALLRLAAEDHLFLEVIHHIVSDGWSAGLMHRELIALYAAFRAHQPSPLAPLPIQYGDFAWWQRSWLSGAVLAAQLAYWRGVLGGELAPLELPTDRPRPPVQTFRGGTLFGAADGATVGALRGLAREAGASLFMTLLAAFQALLARLAGQSEVIVGSPIAGRRHVETEGLIGLFLNSLALRTDLDGDPTWRELVARVRDVTLGAYAHQDIPFEALLAAIKPPRDLARTPVFQVFLNMLNLSVEVPAPPELEIDAGPPPQAEAKFDLTLYVAEAGPVLRFHLVYNADLFDATRMEEMLRQLGQVLSAMAADPGRRLGELSLVTPAAAALLPDPRQALDASWHGAVHDLFLAQAARRPERTAVIDPAGSWTYGELGDAVRRLAAGLRAAGLAPGERVAIWAHRSAPVAWAVLGTLAAGGAFVMLDPAYPAARLVEVLRLAAPSAWLAVAAAGPPPAAVEELLAGWQEAGSLRCRMVLPGGGAAGAAGWVAALPAAEDAPPACGPDDLAFVAFTSGSAGVPKGIAGRHGPLSHFLPWLCERFGFGPADRFSLLSGLAHDPLQRDIFTALATGATLCAPDPAEVFMPGRLATWAAASGITVANLTPAMGQVLTEPPADGGAPCTISSLRCVMLVGDVLTRLDVDRIHRLAPAAVCVNLYGSTETQRAVSFHAAAAAGGAPERRAAQVLPLGRGMQDVQLLVVAAGERLAGIGEVGEIWMRSPHLARGYLGDEALTRERFRTNPFTGDPADRVYRTGDLGRYLPDGEAVFAGRADQQVKIRGFRIEPGEIQAAIGRFPGVRESVVVAREERGERYLAAYVVREAGAPAVLGGGAPPDLAGELRRFLAARLPDYMVPAAFVELAALPLTPNGKVDRRALPPPRRREAAGAAGAAAPLSAVEARLAGIWSELLRFLAPGQEPAGVGIAAGDNFFALGGHSLLAIQLVSRVRAAFGVELPVRTVFEAPTLAQLAEWIERAQRTAEGGGAPGPLTPADRAAPLPLSFAQERLWFLHLLAPESAIYNMLAAARLRGPLDAGALAGALGALARRHEALRTVFRSTGAGPVQVVQPWAPPRQPLADLSALPPPAREAAARRAAERFGACPFDLAHGPLVRALLLRLAADEHVALWSTHHVASDGWSLTEVFVPEMVRLYEAAAARRPAALPSLPIQYADYAVWQRGWLRGPRLDEQVAYWRRQLAGLDPLDLPADRPRLPAPSGRGGSRSWQLPAAVRDRLGAVAAAAGATPFMALFAVFAALVARCTRRGELPVGMPAANRSRAEIEGLIGFFVNSLVLRGEVTGDPTLPALLARTRATVLGALSHQDLPFERLVDALGLPRNPYRPPLLRVMFQLQTALAQAAPAGRPASGATEPAAAEAAAAARQLTVEPFAATVEAAKFDLVVHLFEAAGAVGGLFRYDADLFDGATVARLVEQYGCLLEEWSRAPERRAAEVPMLREPERHQLLVEWNPAPARRASGAAIAAAGAEAAGAARCLHRRFEAQVDRRPDAVAICLPGAAGQAVTYAELDRRANRLARHLLAAGVRPGDRVALLLPRTVDMVTAILATLKVGAAYVPLEPAAPAERAAHILADSGAGLLVTAGEPGALSVVGAVGAAGAPRTLRLDAEPERRAIARRGGARLTAAPASPGAPPAEAMAVLPAYVIYTSGSTGRPKGVVVSHANVERLFTATAERFGFATADVWTLFHSYAFDFSVWEIWGALLHGGRLVVVPYWESRSPAGLHRLLRDERVTVLNQTPSAFRQLVWAEGEATAAAAALNRAGAASLDRAAAAPELALRWVIFGGEALEPAALAPWFARHGDREPRLVNMYGITETTVHVTWRALSAADLGGGSLIGGPLDDLTVHLLDPALQPVPIGVAGELHVGGAGLAHGYLGRPGLTAERFIPDPFAAAAGARLYRSGDLARRTAAGDLEYLGRNDQQVKIRGFRIELGEVEAALAAQPGVREAAVEARRDGPGGEPRLVAWCAGEGLDAAALRRGLAARLPDHMLPAAFVLLTALPLTPNGKVDRRALPAPAPESVAAAAGTAAARPPRTQLERLLAHEVQEVLGLPAGRAVGIDDDFFALGGTSITSAILAHRLQTALGEEVHVVTLFDHPTIAGLAAHLHELHPRAARRLDGEPGSALAASASAAAAGRRSVLVPLQPGEAGRRPLFCVHSVGGEVVSYRDLAQRLGAAQPVFGLQSPEPPLLRVEQMAARYVEELRAVQPRGPYRLAGWSMGGIVAFEMARQLEAQGEATDVLAVIDSASPARWAGERERNSAEMVALFAAALEQLHGGDLQIPADLELPDVDPASLDSDAALDLALDLGRRVGLLAPNVELAELRRLFERFRVNRLSLAAYAPHPYGGPLHLFRAAERPATADDPTLGWGALLNGGLRLYDVPGDHRSIMKRGVETLAARLRELLDTP